MIVSINQPAYLPWLGYFHRIAASDVHVVLDHVQFEKNSFTNRNRIRIKEGSTWLTVPLRTKGQFGDLAINKIEISQDTPWSKKHAQGLKMNYARSVHYGRHQTFFDEMYNRPWEKLNDLLAYSNAYLLECLGIKTRLIKSSELDVSGTKEDLVLEICRKVGATTYLSGPLGRNYINGERFSAEGLRLVYQDYKHPEYPQAFAGFEPYMSVVDLLFNCGPESLAVIMNNQETYT